MRMLRYVGRYDGSSTDPDRVIVEDEDGSEQFCLEVSAELRIAVRSELPRRAPSGPPPAEPRLRPREIQTRVRAGESPQAIAEQAGLSPESVLRFAAPVLDERARVASEARRARARRNGTDGPLVVFGETVDARFRARGVEPDGVTWDSYRREDGQWVVSARWLGEDAPRQADWSFALGARMVTPLDDAAFDLLSDRPIRPVPPPFGPPPVPVQPVVRDVSAEPVDQADEPADRADTDVLPALPLGLVEPATVLIPRSRRLDSEEERAERARIPSWDDILLGVRRKRD